MHVMGSSAASPLFLPALIDAASPSSPSPVCVLSRSPLFGSLGRQTSVSTFPPWLPVGNVCCKRTPSQSLQQSLAMTPKGVVIMVTCTVSSAILHFTVTSEHCSFHATDPTEMPPSCQSMPPVRVEDVPLTTWRMDGIDRSRGQRIIHERGERLWHRHGGNLLAD